MGTNDVVITFERDFVATVEINRAPHNYFDASLIAMLADSYEELSTDPRCRAILLCSQGKNFCAGADFSGTAAPDPTSGDTGAAELYRHAVRLFEGRVPVIAAVQGAAIGGGLGLALSADFRVASPRSRFSANFAQLGLHQGFGISVTLPWVVGNQRALELLYSGRSVRGDEALAIGLCDKLVAGDEVRTEAHFLAASVAASAPLAVSSIRSTMRGELPRLIKAITERENQEQIRLRATQDFEEGITAARERRPPQFLGR